MLIWRRRCPLCFLNVFTYALWQAMLLISEGSKSSTHYLSDKNRFNVSSKDPSSLDLPMSEKIRQRQVTLNEGKTLVNTMGVYGSKFGNETHFLSFAAIVATRTGTEGSNFHVWNAMTTRIEMSGNRLVSIVGRNCTTMHTEPCP